MKIILCTLYNSLYLDKGLVLFDSLCEVNNNFLLYVLCMDDKTYEIISEIGDERMFPLRLDDIENTELLTAKANRPFPEYCWTCTSALILYVLRTYHHEYCTYIDADMYFYHDPQILVDELIQSGKSVQMVPHRFTPKNQNLSKKVGTYCVEFNTFKNDKAGLQVLTHWYQKCLECCSNLGDGIHWGDQKYMDKWPVLFPDSVHVCEHPGAGIAPWNIESYNYDRKGLGTVFFKEVQESVPVIFWHFQSIRYIHHKKVKTGVKARNKDIDYQLVHLFYTNYLQQIRNKNEVINKHYGLNCFIIKHPALNKSNAIKGEWIIRSFKNIIPDCFRHDYIIHL